ncbi:MAG: hypothetical protein JWL97_3166, partial [Gemmatimonadales bacterium]|nr:hypothetical protein [Gemmatimonadales bacterium]
MRLANYGHILTSLMSLTVSSELVAQAPIGIFDAQTDVGRV